MATSKPASKSGDAKPRKIMDVAEPGKSAATPSAKPIIVSNRPVLRRDPMMLSSEGPSGAAEEEHQTTLPRASKTIKIMPLSPLSSTDAKPDTAEHTDDEPLTAKKINERTAASIPVTVKSAAQKEVAKDLGVEAVTNIDRVDKPAAPLSIAVADAEKDPPAHKEAPKADSVPVQKPQSVSKSPEPAAKLPIDPPKEKEPEPEIPEAPPVQTSVPDDEKDIAGGGDDQLAPNQAVDQAKRKAEEEKLAKLAEQEKVIESKQYYLPINSVERQRRSLDRIILVFVLVLLLALVWLDIVMDAGIVKIGGVQPLTHFFKS